MYIRTQDISTPTHLGKQPGECLQQKMLRSAGLWRNYKLVFGHFNWRSVVTPI
jgi:hypothetical protein